MRRWRQVTTAITRLENAPARAAYAARESAAAATRQWARAATRAAPTQWPSERRSSRIGSRRRRHRRSAAAAGICVHRAAAARTLASRLPFAATDRPRARACSGERIVGVLGRLLFGNRFFGLRHPLLPRRSERAAAPAANTAVDERCRRQLRTRRRQPSPTARQAPVREDHLSQLVGAHALRRASCPQAGGRRRRHGARAAPPLAQRSRDARGGTPTSAGRGAPRCTVLPRSDQTTQPRAAVATLPRHACTQPRSGTRRRRGGRPSTRRHAASERAPPSFRRLRRPRAHRRHKRLQAESDGDLS